MTRKRICYTHNGAAVILVPTPNFIAQLMANGASEDDAMGTIQARDLPPDAGNIIVCDCDDIPTDRTFRGAWERDTSPSPAIVAVNMAKARDIHRGYLRKARAPKFANLDGEWMKATGQGHQNTADRIEAERQALRDLPQNPAIDTATTPDDLNALWPPELLDF